MGWVWTSALRSTWAFPGKSQCLSTSSHLSDRPDAGVGAGGLQLPIPHRDSVWWGGVGYKVSVTC